MNLTMKYKASHTDRASEDMKKIICFCDHITWTELKGTMTDEEVTLVFKKNEWGEITMELTVAGKIDDKTNTLTAHMWDENVPLGSIDWHPVDSNGIFDLQKFKDNLKSFFANI